MPVQWTPWRVICFIPLAAIKVQILPVPVRSAYSTRRGGYWGKGTSSNKYNYSKWKWFHDGEREFLCMSLSRKMAWFSLLKLLIYVLLWGYHRMQSSECSWALRLVGTSVSDSTFHKQVKLLWKSKVLAVKRPRSRSNVHSVPKNWGIITNGYRRYWDFNTVGVCFSVFEVDKKRTGSSPLSNTTVTNYQDQESRFSPSARTRVSTRVYVGYGYLPVTRYLHQLDTRCPENTQLPKGQWRVHLSWQLDYPCFAEISHNTGFYAIIVPF